MTTYQGVLHFFSETGTEGGAWAFQDEKFIGLDGGRQFSCTRCGRVWDKDSDVDEPAPIFAYWRDDPHGGSYHSSDAYDPDGNLGPGEFDQTFTAASNGTSRACAETGHTEWVNMYPDGMWSYEGLHILNDGDVLTVFGDTDHQVLFHGVVQLSPRQNPYAADAYVADGGLTAHRRPPVGTDETWWFHEKRAQLITEES